MQAKSGKSASKRGAIRTPRVDCLVDARSSLAQGLLWDDQAHRLFWIDTPAGELFAVSLTSGVVQSWSLPCAVGAIALCRDGRVLVTLLDGIYLFDLITYDLHFLAALHAPWAGDGPGGLVGADGAFWIGGTGPEAADALLRVTPDGAILRVAAAEAPAPMSGAVDVEGAYWSCDASAGCVTRFSPEGDVLMRIPLLVPAPTSCCFGAADMRLLFVASRRSGLDSRELSRSPASGGIFLIHVDVPGVRIRRFQAATR
jgi:sugar lactone lactonase YvrE